MVRTTWARLVLTVLTKFNIFICFFFQISHFGPGQIVYSTSSTSDYLLEIYGVYTSFWHCEELKHTSNALFASIQTEELKQTSRSLLRICRAEDFTLISVHISAYTWEKLVSDLGGGWARLRNLKMEIWHWPNSREFTICKCEFSRSMENNGEEFLRIWLSNMTLGRESRFQPFQKKLTSACLKMT